MPPHEAADAVYDLVIFDLDGTLVDTAPEIADSINEYLVLRGLPQAPLDEVRAWIGHGAQQLLQRARASRGIVADGLAAEMELFAEIYLSRCGSNSRAYEGVPQTLAALRAHGTRLALLTNKETRFALPLLAAHGLHDHFNDVVCGDTLAARKPDPLPVRHCMAQAGVPAGRTLLVGDSEIDIVTARAAGVSVWLVAWGYNGACNESGPLAARPAGDTASAQQRGREPADRAASAHTSLRSDAVTRPDRMITDFTSVATALIRGGSHRVTGEPPNTEKVRSRNSAG